MSIKKSWLLLLIIILAFLLRVVKIDSTPPGLTWDEAALGYNAYSILNTGRDEYGSFLPLQLKSFGDYKPAVYAYLIIPFIPVFGLSELAVRIPSVIFGTSTVIVLFLLVGYLFQSRKLALWSALSLAISPWHIHFSRGAFETNIALFLNLLGFYFLQKGLKDFRLLVYSALIFSISLFTYQSSRLFIPLLALILLIANIKKIRLSKKLIAPGTVFICSFLILGVLLFLNNGNKRLVAINLFSYPRTSEQINQEISESLFSQESLLFTIYHGEWWAYVRGAFERFLLYLSPRMLFIDGDYSPRHRVPDLGLLYYFSIVFIPVGIVYLHRRYPKQTSLFFWWIIISILPAVFSRDLINILRAQPMVIPLTIFEGAGMYFIFSKFKPRWKLVRGGILSLLVLLIMINIAVYLNRYYVHLPIEYSKDWLYGYKQVITESLLTPSQYQKVIFSDIYGQPYIYYLFYTKYNPKKFQQQAILEQPSADVGTIRKIDNIEFRRVYLPDDRSNKNSLIIGTPEEIPLSDIKSGKEFVGVSEVYFLDKSIAFRSVKVKQ